MKRHGHLWDGMISFENLLRAAEKAPPWQTLQARRRLASSSTWNGSCCGSTRSSPAKTYRPGPYRTFTIYEGKTRQISAAPFRDRVVHHALTGVLEPIFERSFIFDSYACRKGKGTHAAVDRCQQFARRYRYVLKADVRKFFPSIDHEILKDLIARKIKDPRRPLAGRPDHRPQQPAGPGADVVPRRRPVHAHRTASGPAAGQPDEPVLRQRLPRPARSLRHRPAGDRATSATSMTSWSSPTTSGGCTRCERRSSDFLETLRLQIHQDKSVVFPCEQGIRFLGYRVFPTHRLLAQENVRRFRRRMRWMQRAVCRWPDRRSTPSAPGS